MFVTNIWGTKFRVEVIEGNWRHCAHHSRCIPNGGMSPYKIKYPRKSSPLKHISTKIGVNETLRRNLNIQHNPMLVPIRVQT